MEGLPVVRVFLAKDPGHGVHRVASMPEMPLALCSGHGYIHLEGYLSSLPYPVSLPVAICINFNLYLRDSIEQITSLAS